MSLIMKIFGWPLGFVMLGCYLLTGNDYALAIVAFTVVTRILLLPLSIKQQKEQAKMMLFQPKLENIQKKYGNNRERYNEEIQKLYTEEGYNPMTGCLPSLIQFPILFGVIDVVYKPIYHILRVANSTINEMVAFATEQGFNLGTDYYTQLNLLKVVRENKELFEGFDQEIVSKIADFNMTLFGLDLAETPQFKFTLNGGFNWYLLIPLACGVFQLVQTIYMNTHNTAASNKGMGAMNIMLYTMPLFSVYIAFIVPAGVGFYWAISAIVMLLQSVLLNLKYNPKEMAEKIQAQIDSEKEEKRQKRIEAREKLKQLQQQKGLKEKGKKEITPEEAATQKEINRRKLAEARRQDAEKYCESYIEVTDDDLK